MHLLEVKKNLENLIFLKAANAVPRLAPTALGNLFNFGQFPKVDALLFSF